MRQIKKHKGFSAINISGMTIGLACCILILLWVQDELSFDRFNENADDIYRVYIEDHFPDGRLNAYGVTPGPLGEALKTEYPEVLDYVRVRVSRNTMVKTKESVFNEKEFAFADPSIFDVFTFPFLSGASNTGISDLSSIVITQSASEKYFGKENPLGKILNVDNRFDFTVSGVIGDVPPNSHFSFDFVVPYRVLERYGIKINDWGSIATYTYILLQEDFPYEEFESNIKDYLRKRNPESITELRLQPVTDIHLRSKSIMGMGADGDIRYIYIFLAVAVFVLLIACINFISLTTARACKRAREIGMRKVMGAKRINLVFQFFNESFFYSFFSLLLSLVLVRILLPAFNNLTGKHVSLNFGHNLGIVLLLFALLSFAGLISGIYPSLYLSSFQPVNVLKISIGRGKRGASFRKSLVVFQFSFSIIFIIGTLLVVRQLEYMRNRDLGFDKENLLYISLPESLSENYESVKRELKALPGVVAVTAASDLPTRVRISSHGAVWEGKSPDEMVELKILFTDYDYLETLGAAVAEGRFFTKEFSTDDQEAFVLNQSAVKALGLESPVGKMFELGQKGTIVGVVQDFHFSSLHQAIQPLVMRISPERFTHLILRTRSEGIPSTVRSLEDKWKKVMSGYPLEYGFIDESIDNLYRVEKRVGTIFGGFTLLSVFISCLGLFGLASFMAELRTREIAVRKVLGASVLGIVILFSKEFNKWVLLAAFFSWPIAYMVMDSWLANFAYRITIGSGPFIISAAMALVISQLTVSYQTIRAARSNPAESLKYE